MTHNTHHMTHITPHTIRAVNLYRNNRLLTCTCQGRSIIVYNYTKPVMHNAYAFTKVDNLADAKA